MIDIFFIRHGATEGNLRRRYIGRTDEPLCEAGIAQVKLFTDRSKRCKSGDFQSIGFLSARCCARGRRRTFFFRRCPIPSWTA